MNEATDIPLPPPEATPKKTNPWIIAIVVIIVICCGCFGVIGLVFGFWDPIQQSLQSLGFYTLLPLITVLP
jgi:Na+-transporting NADH:ubiquinone oxidoreductase subunit NqrB